MKIMKNIIPLSEDEVVDRSTTWRLSVPPFAQATRQQRLEDSPAEPRRVLIADDDPSVRQMLGRLLESEHYTVVGARTGREAIAMFRAAAPDLVLLDLNMPGKDGWEAFHMMDAINPMIPVIIITARPSQYEQATRMGADALMEKPLDLALLLETIGKFLAESQTERRERITNRDFGTLNLTHA
jgi:CheY-like chemotaxis protein